MPRLSLVTAAVAAMAALTIGVMAGCSGADPAPYNDADVTFASEMVSHHEQAVEMVEMAEGRPLDPAVRGLADDIDAAQNGEIGTMTGWLKDWGKPDPDRDPDSAMEMGGAMDGMMSHTEMEDLANADDADFQQAWLELMIEHHEGALEMARAETATGRYPAAVALADEIETSQTAQIAQMRSLVAAG